MDDAQFSKLLHFFDFSWEGYKRVRKGVKKRISRYMRELGCPDMDAFVQRLETHPEVRERCERLMSVSISRFFRDRGVWSVLESTVLPSLLENQKRPWQVWSAGCASGEEVYSFKIVWEQLKKRQESLPALTLLATDIRPDLMDRAKRGRYTRSSLKELRDSLKARYFSANTRKTRFTVRPLLQTGIFWQYHHLLDPPPDRDFQVIFLRNNLLTYYSETLQTAALEKIASRLIPGGVLVIGSHESIPRLKTDLRVHPACPLIHHRRTA